jgi:hypothetical protein
MAQWFDITAPKGATLQTTMAAWGVPYDPNDPYASLYQAAIDKARPYGGKSPYQKGGNWDIFAEMCLRFRGLLFAETKIGDCGFSGSTQGFNIGQAAGLTQAGLGGAAALSSVAGVATGFAKDIPIIGSAIGLVADVFTAFSQHHAQAVKIEKATLCGAVQQISPYINAFYQALEQGAATPAQAVAAMQQAAQSFHQAWTAAGVKSISCNDACGMDAIMSAHIAFIGMLQEGAAPAPVPQNSAAVIGGGGNASTNYVLAGQIAQTSAGGAPVATEAPAPVSTVPGWLILVLILVAVFLIFRKGEA